MTVPRSYTFETEGRDAKKRLKAKSEDDNDPESPSVPPSLASVRVTSQVGPLGTVGDVLGDVRRRPKDQEEDLREDVGDGPVYRTARGSSEVRQDSVQTYVKAAPLFALVSLRR